MAPSFCAAYTKTIYAINRHDRRQTKNERHAPNAKSVSTGKQRRLSRRAVTRRRSHCSTASLKIRLAYRSALSAATPLAFFFASPVPETHESQKSVVRSCTQILCLGPKKRRKKKKKILCLEHKHHSPILNMFKRVSCVRSDPRPRPPTPCTALCWQGGDRRKKTVHWQRNSSLCDKA